MKTVRAVSAEARPCRRRPLAREFVVALALVITGSAARAETDLTLFRPSYAHVSASDWHLYASGDLRSWQVAETTGRSSDIQLRPGWDWHTLTRSDPTEFSLYEYLWLGWDRRRYAFGSRAYGRDIVSLSENLAVNWDRYLGKSDFLIGLEGSGFLDPRVEFRPDTGLFEVAVWTQGDLTLGAGYGRLRDAWPLHKADRLIGILRENGVLENEPGPDELLELSDFISRSWTLFYRHDRASRFYYDSLESYLLKTGAISEPLPAYVLMRLDDKLTIGSDYREFGSRVFAGIYAGGSEQIHFYPAHDSQPSALDTSGNGWLHPVLKYCFARPFGVRWTTSVDCRYELSPFKDQLEHRLDLSFAAAYDVADRLRASVAASLNPAYVQNLRPFRGSTFEFTTWVTGGFQYYLTDRLSLDTYASWWCERDPATRLWSSTLSLQFDLTAGPRWLGTRRRSNRQRGQM